MTRHLVPYFVPNKVANTAADAGSYVSDLFDLSLNVTFLSIRPVRSWFRRVGWEVIVVVII